MVRRRLDHEGIHRHVCARAGRVGCADSSCSAGCVASRCDVDARRPKRTRDANATPRRCRDCHWLPCPACRAVVCELFGRHLHSQRSATPNRAPHWIASDVCRWCDRRHPSPSSESQASRSGADCSACVWMWVSDRLHRSPLFRHPVDGNFRFRRHSYLDRRDRQCCQPDRRLGRPRGRCRPVRQFDELRNRRNRGQHFHCGNYGIDCRRGSRVSIFSISTQLAFSWATLEATFLVMPWRPSH